jgi:hypothetical protein
VTECEEGRPAKAPLVNADASQRQVPPQRTTATPKGGSSTTPIPQVSGGGGSARARLRTLTVDYADQHALVDYWRTRWTDPLGAAHVVYENARFYRGATPEQAAALPLVRAALREAYAPCDPDAPLDSPAFANHVRRTIHLARLATDTYPREPARPLNEVQRRLLRNGQPRRTATGPDQTASSGTVPTGRAPDADLWTAANLNVPEILLAATRRLGLPSPSEHDLSLATRLRQLDWTPQQIADLLLWNRRNCSENLKHPGYYTRTVDTAVQTVTRRKGKS